mgnify:CR=1 FL=1
MAALGDGVPPIADNNNPQGINANPIRGGTDPLRRATDWLEDNSKITMTFHRHANYRRYATLRLQEMFNALVQLYQNIFMSHWHHLRRTVENYQVPAPLAQTPWLYVARLYISVWIVDLYASIRRACLRVCPEAYNEYYTQDYQQVVFEYDAFLSQLLSMIKPTVVNLVHETTLFVPRLAEDQPFPVDDMNIFGLDRFDYNENVVHGVVSILRDRRLMKFEKPSETGFGRPFWLFDWHRTGHAYAWFPAENNYDMRDVTVAYIVGVACTPKLGPRDIDDWQHFPGNIIPEHPRAEDHVRVRPVAYHGAVEVRTIDVQQWTAPPEVMSLIQVTLPPAAAQQQQQQQPAAQAQPAPARQQPPAQPQQQEQGLIRYNLRQGFKRRRTDPSTSNDNDMPVEDIEEPPQPEQGEDPIHPEEEAAPPVEPQPDPAPAEPIITMNRVRRFRIITYCYYRQVTDNEDLHSRLAALRQVDSLIA